MLLDAGVIGRDAGIGKKRQADQKNHDSCDLVFFAQRQASQAQYYACREGNALVDAQDAGLQPERDFSYKRGSQSKR